jgi:carboxyl-terminal processing protease
VEKVRGAPGTEVRLEIMRKDQAGPVNLTLTRQIIKVSTVRQQTEGDDIGYVRLTQFNSQTADELNRAIQALAAKSSPAP